MDTNRSHGDVFETNTDFFAFETRMRQTVMDLVEPCVKRSIQERDIILEIKRQNDIMKKKVDEIEFIMQKAQKKTSTTDDLAKQIAQLEFKIRQAENKTYDQLTEMHDRQDEMRCKMEGDGQERKLASIKLEQFTVQIRMFKDDMDTMKDNVRRMVDESHIELKKTFNDFTSQIESFTQSVKLEQAAVERHTHDIKEFYAKLDLLRKRVEVNETQITHIENTKLNSTVYEERVTTA